MSSVNKVILVGHLGRDPEVRHTKGGDAVCNFSLATTEKWGKETHTEWHRIVAWKKLAEICGEYLAKGKQVYIEGRIQTKQWEDNDGNKRESVEIVANNMTMLGQASNSSGSGNAGGGSKGGPDSDDFEDDDIPF